LFTTEVRSSGAMPSSIGHMLPPLLSRRSTIQPQRAPSSLLRMTCCHRAARWMSWRNFLSSRPAWSIALDDHPADARIHRIGGLGPVHGGGAGLLRAREESRWRWVVVHRHGGPC
jgi:hypothetical protein